MHTVNLLEQLTPELIPFILKNLPIQDLYNCHSINDTWKKEVSLELLRRPRREHLIFYKLYYQPEGYYRTAEKMRDVCKKIGYKFTLAEVEDWPYIRFTSPPPLKIININKNYIGNSNINLGSNITIITEEFANRIVIGQGCIRRQLPLRNREKKAPTGPALSDPGGGAW